MLGKTQQYYIEKCLSNFRITAVKRSTDCTALQGRCLNINEFDRLWTSSTQERIVKQ
jgi:hypothetical protein